MSDNPHTQFDKSKIIAESDVVLEDPTEVSHLDEATRQAMRDFNAANGLQSSEELQAKGPDVGGDPPELGGGDSTPTPPPSTDPAAGHEDANEALEQAAAEAAITGGDTTPPADDLPALTESDLGQHGFAKLRAREAVLAAQEEEYNRAKEAAKKTQELQAKFKRDPVGAYHDFVRMMAGEDADKVTDELYESLTLHYAGDGSDSESRLLRETRGIASKFDEIINANREKEEQQQREAAAREHEANVTQAVDHIKMELNSPALKTQFPHLMAEDDPAVTIYGVIEQVYTRSGGKRTLSIAEAAKLAEPIFKKQNEAKFARLGVDPSKTSLAQQGKQGESDPPATTRTQPKPRVTSTAASEADTMDDMGYIADDEESMKRSLRMLHSKMT